jgi:hypothetical protein
VDIIDLGTASTETQGSDVFGLDNVVDPILHKQE